jgi:hypothetical protein
MNMNQTINIPSTSSLVAGLTAAIATTESGNNAATTASSSALGLLTNTSNDQSENSRNIGFAFPAPPNIDNSISQANLAATTAAAILQQTTIANMISSQNTLGNSLNASTNQSMPNLHAGFQSVNNNSAPASNALSATRASPALNIHSPRSTSHLME